MVLQSIVQAVLGGAGEGLAQVASGQDFNINEVLIEALAEFVTAPVEVAGVGGRGYLSAVRKAREAENRKALFAELSGQAQNSKLRQRMPDRFREFVERATANGPVENVYVPADQFVQYFQGIGVDPFALVDELDGVSADDLDIALAGGGDLQIPTATYAAKIAGSEHDAFLMENMRFDPDAFTAREAAEFNARAQDALEEAWEVAEAVRLEQEELRSFEQEIYDTMVSRLRAAGRGTDVATNEAMLYPAFYRVMAERSGMTIEDFMSAYPLPQVRGDLPEGMQYRDVDALNRTLAEARARRKAGLDRRGPSLLEFIDSYGGMVDVGGELRARDAETVKRGKGRKTLKLARSGVGAAVSDMFGGRSGRKHGYEDIAQAAIEAGYMRDNPIANEYREAMREGREVPDIRLALFEAIDRELAGEPDFATEADASADAQADLDRIEEYLAQIGASLDDDDAAIRDAIEADQAGRQYGQFAGARAATLDRSGFMRAQDMRDAGATRDEIYDETGFFVGPDGRWRFEISDADAELRTGAFDRFSGRMTASATDLRQVLHHPKLYEAYPQLLDMWVDLSINPKNQNKGTFFGDAPRIAVEAKTIEKARSILLHEIAHAIQHIEGFATGGNLSMGEAYSGAQVEFLQNDIRQLEADLEKAYANLDRDKIDELTTSLEAAQRGLVRAAKYEYYRRIAGEVEARNVQTRDRMQRRADGNNKTWENILREDGIDPKSPEGIAWLGGEGWQETVDAPWWTADVTDDKIIIVRSDEAGEAYKALSAGYRGQHEAPGRDGGAPLHDLTGGGEVYPDDIYSDKAAQYYGHFGGGSPLDRETIKIIHSFKGKPDAKVTIYRAIPSEIDAEINPGDWVTVNRNYAVDHGETALRGDYKIIEKEVTAGDVFTNGDSIHEFGYSPVGPLILYQPAYHGSPHLFDKFSTDHIGTGEGAQAFGWGLYFAGKKEIADYYRQTLAGETFTTADGATWSPDSLEHLNVRVAARKNGVDIDATIARARELLETATDQTREILEGDIASLEGLKARGPLTFNSGRVFEVDIPADDELLIWDLPLDQQPERVRAAIEAALTRQLNTSMERGEDWAVSAWDNLLNEWDWSEETGEDFYKAIGGRLDRDPLSGEGSGGSFDDKGNPRARLASVWLSEIGVPGHRYLDGVSRNPAGAPSTDGDTYNYVIYDDSRINVTRFEQSGDVRGARGSIQFPAGGVGNGDTVVRLFQSADLSTFLHESGHYFLTVLRDLATKGEGGAVADFDTIKAWWLSNAGDVAKDAMRVMPDANVASDDVIRAIESGGTGDVVKDAAIDVGMQEQFARAFETYLMEGKAPSIELRTAFEKFRAWLISIYQRLAGLDVKVSDDIRGVFDRMIASDAEIAQAQAEAGATGPLFATAEEMGLTQAEYDAFLKLRVQAEDEAKARLLRVAMAPVKRAREKWFKDERAKVRDEVEREVNAHRYYRALEWMGNRRWLGEGKPESLPDIRLSKDILVDRYGEGVLKTLPRGKQTIYALEGGIDPDDAAGWFGFDSGDEMIKALETAPPRKEAIEAETDKLMRERHGDPLNDGSIEAEALDAVHVDKRGQWIAAELKAVVEVAETGIAMTAKEARATARDTVSRMRVRDAMNVNRFLTAERKAAEEAAKLGAILAREGVWMGNARRRIATKARAAVREEATPDAVAAQVEQANRSTANYNETVGKLIAAKRRQLLNHALYMEARKVADEVEKAERFIARLTKKSKREQIAGAGRRSNATFDYLAAIDEILERYDFRKMSGKAEDRRGALVAFIEGMKAAGRENELAIPDHVLQDAGRKPYKTVAVEELRGVIDSLKNLEHIALRWNKLIDAETQRELDAAVQEIADAFDANLPKRPPGRVASTGEGLRNAARQFLDLVLNASTILREIDGLKDFGPAYRNIKAPIDAAMTRLISRREKAAVDLDALYAVYSKDERRRMAVREHIPALGYAMSKWERIAVALNTGNEGNFSRLTDKRIRGSLTEAQVTAVLSTLDERDADFIQSVWDYVASFRNDIAARERRATGVEPAWVEPKPVTIAGKALSGGYYPLKYDPRLSSLARDDEVADIAQSLQAGRFGKAQTRNGHLKERAKSSGRDIQLDMSVLHRHVNQVIYDLELSEPVANAWRILQDGRIRSAFMDAGKQPDFDALETWLKDVAEGELRSADLVGRGARALKSNFTAAKLAFNLSTVAVQITGLSQSMVVVGKKDFMRGLNASLRRGVVDEIEAKSQFMRARKTTFNKDIFDFYNDPKTGPVASRWGDIKREIIGPLSFWLMTKVQFQLVDVPTWMAGYKQGLRKFGGDEAKAVAHADAIVKRAQASGMFSDRSAVERGSVNRTARQNDVVRLFTALGSYMFAKFNVAYERTTRARRTIASEGASVQSVQEALSWTLDMAFLFTLEAVIIAAIKGRLPDSDDEDDLGWIAWLAKETGFSAMATVPFVRDIASVASGFEGGGAYGAITKEFAEPFKQASQGEIDKALIKSIVNATGLATGLPATQANRIIDAAARQAEGDDVSPLEYLLGRMGK
jgi:hypothetical protein